VLTPVAGSLNPGEMMMERQLGGIIEGIEVMLENAVFSRIKMPYSNGMDFCYFYAEILNLQNEVCFWNDGSFYDIKDYDGDDGGYMVEVYKNEHGRFTAQGEDEPECLTWYDGGQCVSEDTLEAIEFALEL